MAVPEHQDGRTEIDEVDPEDIVLTKNTRQGGKQRGALESNSLGTIIVDVREFRSKLPCALHVQGFEIVPKTLVVGDYLLTPDICVERKSISDLFSSFNSGRLYTQVRFVSHCSCELPFAKQK